MPGFINRFGRYDSKLRQAITNRHVLWMHAVSVGEVNVCTQLIAALEIRMPNLKIVVSTTTSTGMGELQKKLPTHVSKIYYPIDTRRWVTRALAAIRPEAIVLIEAEIWPNFLWRAQDMQMPVFLVNARLSDSSYRGYKRFGFLFRKLFASFIAVGVQDEQDAEKLKTLGCRQEALHLVGSLKFDAAPLDEKRRVNVSALLAQLGVKKNARILVGGSTHKGEDTILAEQFLRLRARFPDLFLILVPRHFERSREVGRELRKLGVEFVYRTEIGADVQYREGEIDCLLVNTTGELKHFYECASVIFVGKSLTAEGGQNPIEPGALGKSMVFGPNMQNFAEVVRRFLVRDGAMQAQDASELEKIIGELLEDEPRRQQLGRNAQAIVRENQGAIERTAEMIVKHLDRGEFYVAPRKELAS